MDEIVRRALQQDKQRKDSYFDQHHQDDRDATPRMASQSPRDMSRRSSFGTAAQHPGKPAKQRSLTSNFTSGPVDEDEAASIRQGSGDSSHLPNRQQAAGTPSSQLKGPFTVSAPARRHSHSAPHQHQAQHAGHEMPNTVPPSEALQNHNTTLQTRPDPARRNTSTAYFFSRLAGVDSNGKTRPQNQPGNQTEMLSEEPQEENDSQTAHESQTPTRQSQDLLKTPNNGQHSNAPNASGTQGRGWAALRARIRHNDHADGRKNVDQISKSLNGQELVAELGLGLLPVMMLKMALMDRDDHGGHRIPVLMNYLKLRITDSVYPYHNAHALFRIELEYGDGLLKWVIYRELRDFVNLHAHYRIAGLTGGSKSEVEFPSFPKTSLPYFNVLKREKTSGNNQEISKAEFARAQREGLENYLLKVIRSVMFKPEANRLARFLEISALAIQLSHQGGSTGKQGFLRLLSSGVSRKAQSGIHPLTFKSRHDNKWFIVRESYIVVVDGPEVCDVFDVFLFDSQFNLERPKRLYRQGINAVKDRFDTNDEKRPGPSKEESTSANTNGAAEPGKHGDPNDPSTTDLQKADPSEFAHASQHTFYVNNADRRLKIVAKSERLMDQFIASIERMAAKSIWIGKNRFDSFAPIRMNVACQWLIDGVSVSFSLTAITHSPWRQRDYLWNLSRALAMAKKVVYIHDWWLSPELYLRRPPVANPEWRLDRLLKRKAQEGVKIYVIIYKEVGQSFTPVDSFYTKNRLHDLHPNISVQRSPDSEARNLLWSHHEKICVIDETIAFMGGIDLCFGRWDTPGHTLVDDRPKNYQDIDNVYKSGKKVADEDIDDYQIWPGKDYSNQRAGDFHTLNKPEEDMYDRHSVPRQPWHDVGMQIVGQPARDLCRHFVQRWNWLLRIKHHSRLMPFLIPPADFSVSDLEHFKIVGTCEAQICRSAGPWSLGTPKRIEHSIQNAYCKAIQLSEAFVYIENQYFSTSTVAENVKIENQIGDALVSRIIRAHSEGMPWRACIIIPLTPGYPMPMDSPDAAAVRMIMEAQARSMYRGENSIFARLRREGIDPSDYINFFSLRAWGKMRSGQLTSQDIYIHNKIMIVDDRLAIIGSANINERSQRGDRDSEVACVVRDTDMIDSTMGGVPFKVGRFAHTMRIRLMREHIGVDVDQLAADGEDKLLHEKAATGQPADSETAWDPSKEQRQGEEGITGQSDRRDRYGSTAGTIGQGVVDIGTGLKEAAKFAIMGGGRNFGGAIEHTAKQARAEPHGSETLKAGETLEEQVASRSRGGQKPSDAAMDPEAAADERAHSAPAHHTEEELRHMVGRHAESSVLADTTASTKTSLKDKILENTAATRAHKVSTSTNSVSHDDAHSEAGGSEASTDLGRERTKSARPADSLHPFTASKHRHTHSASRVNQNPYTLPTAAPEINVHGFSDPLDPHFYLDVWTQVAARNTEIFRKVFRCTPDDRCLTWTQFKEWDLWEKRHHKPPRDRPQGGRDRTSSTAGSVGNPRQSTSDGDRPQSPSRLQSANDPSKSPGRPIRITDEGFTMNELEQMEKMLAELRGNLVIYPVKFLESEAVAGNNLFSRDRIQPMAVYD